MNRKKVSKMVLHFDDGTSKEIVPWNGWFIERESFMKAEGSNPFKGFSYKESEVRWSDFEERKQNAS